jgi:hypothetical protein
MAPSIDGNVFAVNRIVRPLCGGTGAHISSVDQAGDELFLTALPGETRIRQTLRQLRGSGRTGRPDHETGRIGRQEFTRLG